MNPAAAGSDVRSVKHVSAMALPCMKLAARMKITERSENNMGKCLNWMGLIALCVRDQRPDVLSNIENLVQDDLDTQVAVFRFSLWQLGIVMPAQ